MTLVNIETTSQTSWVQLVVLIYLKINVAHSEVPVRTLPRTRRLCQSDPRVRNSSAERNTECLECGPASGQDPGSARGTPGRSGGDESCRPLFWPRCQLCPRYFCIRPHQFIQFPHPQPVPLARPARLDLIRSPSIRTGRTSIKRSARAPTGDRQLHESSAPIPHAGRT